MNEGWVDMELFPDDATEHALSEADRHLLGAALVLPDDAMVGQSLWDELLATAIGEESNADDSNDFGPDPETGLTDTEEPPNHALEFDEMGVFGGHDLSLPHDLDETHLHHDDFNWDPESGDHDS